MPKKKSASKSSADNNNELVVSAGSQSPITTLDETKTSINHSAKTQNEAALDNYYHTPYPFERLPEKTSVLYPVAGVFVLAGLCILFRSYLFSGYELLWTLEGLAYVLITVGCGIAGVAVAMSTPDPLDPLNGPIDSEVDHEDLEDKERETLQFVILNRKLRPDAQAYMRLQEKLQPELPKAVEKLVKTKLKEFKKNKQDQTEKMETELETTVKAQLEKKVPVRNAILQRSPTVFVFNFSGDMSASQTKFLRKVVSLLIDVASPSDEVVVKLTSPGGMVSEYGLAAGQLLRLKRAGLRLTVCVDTVAASGGYLMAVVADQIVASHFAFIGSIGVVAQVPNFHRKLEKNDVDFFEFTAGKYKRPVSFFGAVTEEGKSKFQESLTDIHVAFQDLVRVNRPKLDLAKVATGEFWLASQAVTLGLVDSLQTSDEYLQSKMREHCVIEIRRKKPRAKKWWRWLLHRFISASSRGIASFSTIFSMMSRSVRFTDPSQAALMRADPSVLYQ